ncbi:hypothetical protein CPT_Muldoon_124 [Serratia phage Muldoon]|uniref:Uncharacterized protein n=1 Tax=Serratia phage Muldoon TaxID=2601678 RepID=A0A5P8PHC9_9CAUD|nr:hypothetical protein HYP94_gp123 [Serratia phage Muldoon]QFR56079.1 hypothetical protein CPT_Muldoon_124 [Serratia phage Muldoon]UNA02486.1 hypothetical protein [Serratia phage SP1]
MKILKMIVEFIRAKFATFYANNLSPEDVYNRSVIELNNKITELHQLDITANRQIRLASDKQAEHTTTHANKEKEILLMLEKGLEADDVMVQLALQHKIMAEGYAKRVTELQESQIKARQSVAILGRELDKASAGLELAKMKSEARKMGMSTPDEVEESAKLTISNVDHVIREVNALCGKKEASGFDSTDVNLYKAELLKKAGK